MPLPWLAVSGNRIVEQESGRPVLLRGVNRSGLEYARSLSEASITADELNHIVDDWKANIVRLPFNQEWALASPGYDPEPYLEAIDFVVNTLASRAAYTLLDLQWLDATTTRGTVGSRHNFVAPLPNEASLRLWTQLALRYRTNSSVLFDIFNEPHDVLPDDNETTWRMVGGSKLRPLRGKRVRAKDWHPWAVALTKCIRSVDPGALVFVSGLNWAYDLSCFPIRALDGVVYSTHIYPGKGEDWSRAFGTLGAKAPVFAAEWGGCSEDVAWGQRLANYLDELQMGWTAWSWSDQPHLVEPNSRWTPTRFGQLVRTKLRGGAYDG